jgi:small-conductance mechanosensitive channel
MMPKWHILVSAILAVIIFMITRSFVDAFACFIAGTVIDIDHVFDYYLYSGRLSFDVSEISGFYHSYRKVFVLLHSYELLVFGVVVASVFDAYGLFFSAAVGFVGHMLLDSMSYEMKWISYFFVYRALNGFRLERLCCCEE